MSTPALTIFDDGLGRWGPMTDLRAVFELRTGALTTRQRLERIHGPAAALFVPAALADITATQTSLPVNRLPPSEPVLLVNGRCLAVGVTPWSRLGNKPGAVVVQADGQLVAALVTNKDAQTLAAVQNSTAFSGLKLTKHYQLHTNVLIDRPWHILANLEATLTADLTHLAGIALPDLRATAPELPPGLPAGLTHEGAHPVRVHPAARIHAMVVFNTEKGPIVIDEAAIVGSFCVLAGPLYLGRHSIVQPHTHLRPNTVVGPHCLVAGEVSHSIFQGYSNKAHTGYLGNSLVGEWVNLGADTNVSNLKNTYGSVRTQLDPDAPAEDTGQPKLGPLIGDFTRTAIGTRLMTGSCLSTGTMLALSTFAPKFTPRFAFLTDEGPADQRYDIEKFLAAARKAMSRRDQTLSPAMEARLRELANLIS